MAWTFARNIAQNEPSPFNVGQYTFTNIHLLGGRTYGSVYKAYNMQQRTNFAINVIRHDRYDFFFFFIHLLLHLYNKLTLHFSYFTFLSLSLIDKLYRYACPFSVKMVHLEVIIGKFQFWENLLRGSFKHRENLQRPSKQWSVDGVTVIMGFLNWKKKIRCKDFT